MTRLTGVATNPERATPVEMRRALIQSVILQLHGNGETERDENGCSRSRDRSDYR